MPVFDKGTQQIIVISVNQRVTAVAYCLRIRKLGAGADIEDSFGDYLTFVNYFVQIASQSIDLMLPKVTDHGHGAADVAVEGGVADSKLCFVGVTAEGAAEGC